MSAGEGEQLLRWFATALFIAIGVICILIVFKLVQTRREHLRISRELRRGFEVKLNTGQPPVDLRKENDHG